MRVAPIGELDLATAGLLQDLLIEQDLGEDELLVIDLGRQSFMDCSGLRVLLGAQLRARQVDRHLKVLRFPGQVRRLLALSDADRELDIGQLGQLGQRRIAERPAAKS